MAKRVDPIKAKEAKQKKIAIGGAVLLVALLAIQGPKTLRMLQGPQPVTAPAAASQAPAAPATAAPASSTDAAAAGEAPASAVAAELVSVPDSDQPPVLGDGQLESFERFSSKDPFAQQADPPPPPPAPAPEPEVDAGKPVGGGTPEGESDATDGGFTTGEPAPPVDPPVENATATSIAVNGVAEDVEVEKTFPAAEPTFVLVALGKDGKSVEVGIAGGSYANGEATLKLRFGKKVTLQNTADGSRYELELLSIAGRPLPKKG